MSRDDGQETARETSVPMGPSAPPEAAGQPARGVAGPARSGTTPAAADSRPGTARDSLTASPGGPYGDPDRGPFGSLPNPPGDPHGGPAGSPLGNPAGEPHGSPPADPPGDPGALARRLDHLTGQLRRVQEQLEQVIVGQEDVIRQVLWALLAGGHVLLEGVPGLGKTALVRALGRVLGLQFSRIQFTPDLMPADLLGTHILEERPDGRRGWRWEPGPIWAHLVLADEINRATPKTQSALLEAMAEGQVTTGGTTRPLPRPFFVLATQNPLEMEGTFPLPEAQLDRFLFKVLVPYPSEETLAAIGRLTTGPRPAAPEPVVEGEATVREWMDLARGVPVAGEVLDRAARLVAMTHPQHPAAPDSVRRFVRYGASPRGLQALLLGAKARAVMDGRLNVAYADLAVVLFPALRHRLILNFEAEAAGVDADQVLAELATALDLPAPDEPARDEPARAGREGASRPPAPAGG